MGAWSDVVIVITATNCGRAINSGTNMGSASTGRARGSAAIMGSTSVWSGT